MSITERLCEVKEKAHSVRQQAWRDEVSIDVDVLRRLEEEETLLSRKQEKFFSQFNRLESFHSTSPKCSPFDMQLFWIEKDRSQVTSASISSRSELQKILENELEKVALDHVSLDELKAKDGQEYNAAVQKAGFPAPGGKIAKSGDIQDHPVWKAYKDFCEKASGKQSVQIDKANALLENQNIPYEFVSLQLKGRGKETYWIVKQAK